MIVPVAGVEQVIFDVATALRIPVLVATLLALLFVLREAGALIVEMHRRRRRAGELSGAVDGAVAVAQSGPATGAARPLEPVAASSRMQNALGDLVVQIGRPSATNEMSKVLADFDLGSMRRLERTRVMVRFGPALGLMGTLIPLAPALTGLSTGDVNALTANLRVAFSVTVLGLLIGAIAFTISLVRDRLYAQDLSDLEYVAARLEAEVPAA